MISKRDAIKEQDKWNKTDNGLFATVISQIKDSPLDLMALFNYMLFPDFFFIKLENKKKIFNVRDWGRDVLQFSVNK